MRHFLNWMKKGRPLKRRDGSRRSLRRTIAVWGTTAALLSGCLAAWGIAGPHTQGNDTRPPTSSQGQQGNDKPAEPGKPAKPSKGGTGGTGSDAPVVDDLNGSDDNGQKPGGTKPEKPAAPVEPAPEKPAPANPAPADPAPAKPAPAQPAAPVVTPSTPAGSWPTGATTGVPAGTALTATNGLTVTGNGTVIDARHVKGDILINANNVTIKNSLVEGRIQIRPPYTGLLVQRTEIAGPGTAWAAVTEGIGYANFTCDGCDIHGWGKGAMFDANVTISNSWIHDMPVTSGSHNEAILSLGGPNYTIVNNRLDSGSAGNFTASLAFLNQWNSFTNVLVQGNLFNGGGYCVYAGGEKAHNAQYRSSNVRFVDNTFGTDANPKCGYYGPAIAWDASGPGNTWSGNVMSNGTEVRAPSAG